MRVNVFFLSFPTALRCPLLKAPENGQINCSNSEPVYNSQCYFTCNQGYSLDGHELLTCDTYGNWTGKNPTCQGKRNKQTQKKDHILEEIKTQYTFEFERSNDSQFDNVSTAPAPVTAIASAVTAGGALSLSGVPLAIWLLKRMKQKANKFELSR